MSTIILIPLVLIVLVVLFFIFMFNRLVTLRMRVKEAWSDIDVQLKRRNSLIPNLVESVKGYMQHEKGLLENITSLRAGIETAKDPKELGKLDSELTKSLSQLKIAVEAYPDLKANTNVIQLQQELTDTEDKISYSRRFYNANVLSYNTSLSTFPNVLFAPMLGFKTENFFEANESERADVKVDLTTK